MAEDVSDKCVYLHFSLRTCRFLHRLGKKNPNEVPWGGVREKEEPYSLFGEERDRAPMDTVLSSLEQGKGCCSAESDLVQDVTVQQNRYSSLSDTPEVLKDRRECERRKMKSLATPLVNACCWIFFFIVCFVCCISFFNRNVSCDKN